MSTPANHPRPSLSDEEIDLSHVLLALVNLTGRYLYVLLLAIILGVAIGYFRSHAAKHTYTSSMVVSSRLFTYMGVENMIGLLNTLAAARNDAQLSQQMQVSPIVAAQLNQISAQRAKREAETNGKFTGTDDMVEITVATSNSQAMDSLQVGIIYYLQHQAQIDKRIIAQRKNLEVMQDLLDKEVQKLDSVRVLLHRQMAKGGYGPATALLDDPITISRYLTELYQKGLDLQSELLLMSDIQVLRGLNASVTPAMSRTLAKELLMSIGLTLGVAVLFICIMEIRRTVQKLRREQRTPTRSAELVR